jgi:hypothetical protein
MAGTMVSDIRILRRDIQCLYTMPSGIGTVDKSWGRRHYHALLFPVLY